MSQRSINAASTGMVRIVLVAASLAVGLTGSIRAQPVQWNSELTNTPSLVQVNFGPYGDLLPGDGEEYCGPTSVTMNLYWAASNGFTQLAPASYNPLSPTDQAAALNLDLVIAGLMGTTPTGGTNSSGVNAGMADYFAAKGISTSQYTARFWNPTVSGTSVLDFLNTNMVSNQATNPQTLTLQIFGVGWYPTATGTTTMWTRNGGHFLDPLSVDLTGTSMTVNNPFPSSFEHVPNQPGSNPQTVGVTPVPSDIIFNPFLPYATDAYSQIQSPYLQGTDKGDNSLDKAVINGANAWSIDISALPTSTGYSIAPWQIGSSKYINTNTGTLTVIASLTGTGGFQKVGAGELVLTNSNALSGFNVVAGGSLVSTVSSGTPFGTGSILLENDAILEVRPDDTTPGDVALQVASGPASQLSVGPGGGTLKLVKGANTSLTVTLGGYTDGFVSNLSTNSSASLVIAPDAGLSALGGSIKLLVSGSGANQPIVTNGMVKPDIVGKDTDTYHSGSFLNYSNTNGFITATPVLSTNVDINDVSITGMTIYDANSNQSITGGNTVSVYALQIDGSTLSQSQSGSTIQVGSQGSGDTSGIIFNGGTLSTSNLQFGGATGAIYTSLANGTISSQIEGTGGLTTFGQGHLTISSNNASTLSGPVNVNEGTLIAANSGGSATGTGTVTVYSNASLQINAGASVSGAIVVNNSGTLSLSGGTTTGTVNVTAPGADTSEPGGILQGHGTVAGPATVGGTIKAGPETGGTIEFQNAANLNGAAFFWQLNTLTDSPTAAGIAWNTLKFDLSDLNTQLGTSADPLTIYLDFSLVLGPESSDSFWQSNHTWTLIDFTTAPDWTNFTLKGGNFHFPDGSFTGTGVGTTYLLTFTVPEPGTWLLLACGLAGLALVHRKKTKSARG